MAQMRLKLTEDKFKDRAKAIKVVLPKCKRVRDSVIRSDVEPLQRDRRKEHNHVCSSFFSFFLDETP